MMISTSMSSTTMNTLGYVSGVSSGYKDDAFQKCEKCGSKLGFMGIHIENNVYECDMCGFVKIRSHVSFGFTLKIPNYYSLTKTHSAKNLYFYNGINLEAAILYKKNNSYLKFSKIHKQWKLWINENIIEIVRLSAISDHHNIGHNPQVERKFDPITHMSKVIKEQQGIYLTIFGIKFLKGCNKRQKIGHAINYALKKSEILIWLGATHEDHPAAKTLKRASIRTHKTQIAFYGYKEFREYINTKYYNDNSFMRDLSASFYAPIYITGPAINDCIKHGFTQETLDEYVDKFLTDLDDKLTYGAKLRVIINTGNSGIDTSVIRWAVKNNRYAVSINLKQGIYLNEEGRNCYDGYRGSRVDRILRGVVKL